MNVFFLCSLSSDHWEVLLVYIYSFYLSFSDMMYIERESKEFHASWLRSDRKEL